MTSIKKNIVTTGSKHTSELCDLGKVLIYSHGSARPVGSRVQVHRPRMGRTEFDIFDVVVRREQCTPGRPDHGASELDLSEIKKPT